MAEDMNEVPKGVNVPKDMGSKFSSYVVCTASPGVVYLPGLISGSAPRAARLLLWHSPCRNVFAISSHRSFRPDCGIAVGGILPCQWLAAEVKGLQIW